MAEISEYKEWLASGGSSRAVIETVEIAHPSWSEVMYLTNWDVSVICRIQDSGAERDVEFLPARIQTEPVTISDGTEQSTAVSISAYGGIIYEELKAMTPDDRESPITFRPRLYWSNDQTRQLINPSPVWNIRSVTANNEVVRGELQVSPLRAHKIGRYYTAREWPVLKLAT